MSLSFQKIFSCTIMLAGMFLPFFAQASIIDGTINSTNYKAKFLDEGSFINFGKFTDVSLSSYNVHVTDSQLTGFAWGENTGWINLNCSNNATCATSPSMKVINNNNGNLSGYAWGENAGWISFSCTNNSSCSSANTNLPNVTIDSNGFFSGYAWSENYGWISFDCNNTGASCAPTSYVVQTDWRPRNTRPACSDGVDNDSDGLVDSADAGCHTDGNAGNSATYDPTLTTETNAGTATTGTSGGTSGGGGSSGSGAGTTTGASSTGTGSTTTTTSTSTTSGTTTSSSTTGGTGTGTTSGGTTTDGTTTGAGATGTDTTGGTTDTGTTSGTTADGTSSTTSGTTTGSSASDESTATGSTNIIPSLPEIIQNLTETIDFTTESLSSGFIKFKDALEDSTVNTAINAITTTGVVAGIAISAVSALFANPLTFADLFLIPGKLWTLIWAFFGIKKKHWGTVYDSVTKQPLDPAIVVLQDLQGNEVATAITDLDGRYGFLVNKGTYRMIANKTNYKFPSTMLAGKERDELYDDLYFGGDVIVDKDDGVIIKNIPLDPLKFDWNEFAKKDQNLMKFFSKHDLLLARISSALFIFGFGLSILTTITNPHIYNVCILILYIILGVMRRTVFKTKPGGIVIEKSTGNPLSFGIIRIFSTALNREIAHKVCDKIGRYYCILPNGNYFLKIEKKNLDGSYSLVYTSEPIEVTKGYIKRNFEI